MGSEKIDALELDINAKLTTENLDKLITALGKLSKALDNVNAKKVKDEIKDTGDASKEAAAKADLLTNSFLNQAVRITALVAVYRKLADLISTGIENSMSYVENMNLFTVSLGQYSENASKYADTVRDALGIDPSGWIRTQGVFNTLIEGFGVGAEQAAYMSQNLTQLTYDIASFYNLSISDAEKKIQSAVAGELEPVRRLGYDLSQNALTAIAQNPKYYGETTYSVNELTGALEANSTALEDNTVRTIANFNELTQGEKVQLRYIALMTQVTEAQGDMARTLNDPANQIRIFREQMTMTSRALGNVFIPALNEVMPYLIAFFRVVEEGLQKLAAWFGFELPDMSDRMDVSEDVPYYENVVEATGKAAKNAKKMKDYMIGIDELNVLRPDDGTTSGGGSGSENPYALGSIYKTPGYDFLSSSIENRIKDIKEAFDDLGKDFEEHPLQVGIKIFGEGAGAIGQGFWEWYLGKTPDELAQEAETYFGGSIAGALTYELAMNSPAANVGFEFWTWLLGKTDEEIAVEAEEKGITIGQAIHDSFILNNPLARQAGKSQSAIETFFGFDNTLEKRAAEAGRTVGEQFTLEFSKKVAEIFSSNPILQEFYKIATGRDALKDLEALEKKLNYTNSKKTYTKVFPTRDNAATIEAAKHGETALELLLGGNLNSTAEESGKNAIKNFAKGMESGKSAVNLASSNLYRTAFNGANNNGSGGNGFYTASSNMSRRYADGIRSGTSNVDSAGKSLYNSGYNGATNYGKALADYYNVSSGASKEYAKGLVNGVSGARYAGESLFGSSYNGASNYGTSDVYFYNTSAMASRSFIEGMYNNLSGANYAGQSLYTSGYNGASNNGNGGYEYSNLANNFANLFTSSLGSNSALSDSYNAGYKLANEGTWGAYDLNSEFEYVGDMAGQGYVLGIRKNEYKAEYAGGTVANATLYKLKEALGIASPSKETYALGRFFDLGFANAIEDYTYTAEDMAKQMARASLQAIRTTDGVFANSISAPSGSNAGYGVSAANQNGMMNMASSIYQAVVSGISTIDLNGDDRDIKVIIDGKEVFTAVETERRRRGVGVGSNAFGGV